jgi:Methylenetetrahydrofolate reductase
MSRISRLSSLNPLAISITWGAGGSTKDRSLELAGLTQAEGLSTILHLTCTNMEQGLIDDVLQVNHSLLFFLFLLSITLKRQPKSREYRIFLPFEEVSHIHILILHVYILC